METSLGTCESTFTCVELGPEAAPALTAEPTQPSPVLAEAPIHSFTIYLAVAVTALVGAATVAPGLDWSSVKSQVRAAAQLELTEDFRHDLSGWASENGTPADWAFNAGGFAAPGQLALYIQSIPATDYHMQFRATLGEGNLGFVYRAIDFRNYYAGRIVLSTNQRVPTAILERYTVIDGVESARTPVKVPFPLRADTLYDVRVEARGDHFVTKINNKFVDGFSDDQLRTGGVGFFGAGKAARISWLRFAANDDALGRVCAFLASL